MGRIVYAEEDVLTYLKTITSTTPRTIGIVIGHSTKTTDYVVHMAATRDKVSGEALTFPTDLKIKKSWFDNHINSVTPRLPGGLSVLGIFISSPTDIFTDIALIRTLFTSSQKAGKVDTFPTCCEGFETLLAHYNPNNQKLICKSTPHPNGPNTVFTPAQWRFQKNCTQWCQISSKFGIDFPLMIHEKKVKAKAFMCKLENFLSEMNSVICDSTLMLEDKIMKEDQVLMSLVNASGKKNTINGTEISLLEASVYMPLSQDLKTKEEDFGQKRKLPRIVLNGNIRLQVFVSEMGTFADAIEAMKKDICRSLNTRLQLHLDSMGEETEGMLETETIYLPPRRITVSLPNSPLCFTDYVFSGEDCDEVIKEFKLLLDVEVNEKDINMEYEVHAELAASHFETAKKLDSVHSDDLLRSTLPTGFLIAAISFAALLIAIAVALQMQRSASVDENTR